MYSLSDIPLMPLLIDPVSAIICVAKTMCNRIMACQHAAQSRALCKWE
jgi:hypothetical protein